MDLIQKGSQTDVAVKGLTVTMQWTMGADFDLAAAYETQDGKKGLVYFGELGTLDAFPYMTLNKDEGVDDAGGDKQEVLKITHLDEMKMVWLFCWDYTRVQSGQTARFKESDVTLNVVDDTGKQISVKLDTGDMGNVCCLAHIDNSHASNAQLVNSSKAGTLKGLKKLDQLLALVR